MRFDDLDTVAQWLAQAQRIVSFSGAGLSKASGIPTYRDAGGLWTQGGNLRYSSAEALRDDPEGFAEFWQRRQIELARAEPNAAHVALARLQALRPAVTHITQNVDGLLTRAGCRGVLELHGSLQRYRCDACGAADLTPTRLCPQCGAAARPDVVMFGEFLPDTVLAEAERAAKRSEVCLVVGTSAVVYPAAGLVEQAAARGARVVVINVEASAVDGLADRLLRGPAEQLLPALLSQLESRV